MEKVENNLFVLLEYKGKLENGDIFGDSEKTQPLEVEMGSGMMPPGFEQAIMGMSLNDEKEFTLEPDDAFGQRDESRVLNFPIEDVPPEMDVQVGQVISLTNKDGQPHSATVTALDDAKITVDLNHPLAGETLTFNVKVVGISETKTQDLGGCSGGGDCSSGCC